jgi:hypothetical protein
MGYKLGELTREDLADWPLTAQNRDEFEIHLKWADCLVLAGNRIAAIDAFAKWLNVQSELFATVESPSARSTIALIMSRKIAGELFEWIQIPGNTLFDSEAVLQMLTEKVLRDFIYLADGYVKLNEACSYDILCRTQIYPFLSRTWQTLILRAANVRLPF